MSSQNTNIKNKLSFFLMIVLLICFGFVASYNTVSKTKCFKDELTLSYEITQNTPESNSEKEKGDDTQDDLLSGGIKNMFIPFKKVEDPKKEIIPSITLMFFDIQLPPPKSTVA